jgi:putative transposase
MTKSLAIKSAQRSLVVATRDDRYRSVSQTMRHRADDRLVVIRPAIDRVLNGASVASAVRVCLAHLESPYCPQARREAALRVGRGKLPSAPSLRRWLEQFQRDGIEGLVDDHKGRPATQYAWEREALALWNGEVMYATAPGRRNSAKVSAGTVAWELRNRGYTDATNERVLDFLNRLPASQGRKGKQHLGPKEYRLTQTPFVRRIKNFEPGQIWTADGHTIDVYLAHPSTGGLWRPELTWAIDLFSNFIVGWYISNAESSYSTLYCLSAAMGQLDHAPAMFYIDNGSGLNAKLLTQEHSGFYERFSISVMNSLPGNPRARGIGEGLFRIIKERTDKLFSDTYCGHDQAGEVNRRLATEVRQGKRRLPTLMQYRDAVARFVNQYNNTKQKGLGNRSPAEVHADFVRNPLYCSPSELIRPYEVRKVVQGEITLFNRHYRADGLVELNGRKVMVRYDLHDDRTISVRDLQNRWLCEAQKYAGANYVTESRLGDAVLKSQTGKVRRAQANLDEVQRRGDWIIEGEVIPTALPLERAVRVDTAGWTNLQQGLLAEALEREAEMDWAMEHDQEEVEPLISWEKEAG